MAEYLRESWIIYVEMIYLLLIFTQSVAIYVSDTPTWQPAPLIEPSASPCPFSEKQRENDNNIISSSHSIIYWDLLFFLQNYLII